MIDILLETALLLDAYGVLLTERQREMLRMRYEEDLSLSEIAALTGVTRQAAQDSIARGVRQLMETEEALGFVRKGRDTLAALKECADLLRGAQGEAAEARRLLEVIISREGG